MLNKKAMAASPSAGTTTDPDFEYVTMLLHGDGTNGGQNNTFTDGSTNNFTITRNGNTTQGTFSPYAPGWSNFFDGSGDFLSVSSNAAFDIGSSSFTIEAWVYPTSFTNGYAIASRYDYVASTGYGWVLRVVNSTTVRFVRGNDIVLDGTTTIPLNTWTHIAVVRNGSTLTIYANGVQVGQATGIANFTDATTSLQIGRTNTITDDAVGYTSNLRVVKGTAVYTAGFTPPTSALTAITNTSLLTCQSNRFRDNSSNGFTITRNGDVRVQPFNPFSPAAAYSTGTNGGSGYFDGNGDYLSVNYSSGSTISGDFTWETWVYETGTSAYGTILGWRSGSPWVGFIIQRNNNANNLSVAINNGAASINQTSGTYLKNQWNHVALVRSGSTITLYVNGVSAGTATLSGSISPGSSYWTGSDPLNNLSATQLGGYISSQRFVNGTAVYTSGFTPPTSPVTSITNTGLLLDFTNGAIIDNAMDNVLETVGNAQISTSVKKFGTGSLSFDGTGDWLLVPDTPDIRLGSGKFTVELWVYLNATGAARGLIGKGTGTTGWLISTNASNNVVFTYGTSTITSTGTLAASTWYHIAVVREGTSTNQTKIYIGGINDGTGTVSTDFNQTNAMYIGANRTGGDALNGYIDDLRITAGTSRYTANFTPPTAAFPDL